MRPIVAILCLAAAAAGAQNPPPQPPNNGGLPNASPDGKWVAFHSNRDGTPDIYVVGVDGNWLKRLTSGPERDGIAGWTPDSREVVFTVSAPGMNMSANVVTELMAVKIDGSGVRRLGTIPGRGAAISPDGKRIAFSGGRPQASTAIVSSLDGSSANTLSDSTKWAAFNFAWSPNGQRIAYTSMTLGPVRSLSLATMKPDGSDVMTLPAIDTTEGSGQWPAWSPDGKRVAIQVGRYNRADPAKNTAHIWVIDVAAGTWTKLAAHDRPYLDETPTWIDNRTVAFQSDRSGRMEVWIMNADGTGARQLTK